MIFCLQALTFFYDPNNCDLCISLIVTSEIPNWIQLRPCFSFQFFNTHSYLFCECLNVNNSRKTESLNQHPSRLEQSKSLSQGHENYSPKLLCQLLPIMFRSMHYQFLLLVNSQLKVKCFLSAIDFALKAQVLLSSVVFQKQCILGKRLNMITPSSRTDLALSLN